MPIEKTFEETISILQENQKSIEKHDEEARQALWDFWLDKGLWHYKEAAMLVACGATRCIETCAAHMGTCHCECCMCFNGMNIEQQNVIHDIISLFEDEDWTTLNDGDESFPERISPFKFINWAIKKKHITLPQELTLWYQQKNELKDTHDSKTDHGSTTQLKIIDVPSKLFAGKSVDDTVNSLKSKGYSEEIIAHILKFEMRISATAAGRVFFPENEEKDVKTYRNRLNSLINKAKQKYIIQIK